MNDETSRLIASGTWLYDRTIRIGVQIRLRSIRYGTGDYEDDPEICDDMVAPTYFLEWQTTTRDQWTGGGQYLSLAEAQKAVFDSVGETLEWDTLPAQVFNESF